MSRAVEQQLHPTLSETLMEAAELFYGTSTHALSRKRPEPAAAS